MAGRLYDTSRWKQLRKMVLNRTPMCQHGGCIEMATDVDHIDGDTDNNDMDNLKALCHAHHAEKTARFDRSNASAKPFKGHDANGLPTDTEHPWR